MKVGDKVEPTSKVPIDNLGTGEVIELNKEEQKAVVKFPKGQLELNIFHLKKVE